MGRVVQSADTSNLGIQPICVADAAHYVKDCTRLFSRPVTIMMIVLRMGMTMDANIYDVILLRAGWLSRDKDVIIV